MTLSIVISPSMREKLKTKHNVQELEIHECFLNHEGHYLIDDREEHRTDPPTLWFIGLTDRGRQLKIMFVQRDGNVYLKSAYPATDNIVRIYKERAPQA